MSTVSLTRWWWIRHAPVPHSGRIYGSLDVACDCNDPDTFGMLAAELPADAVWVTSNLMRTTQTAEAILAADPAKFRSVALRPLPELAEQNLGEWHGLDREAFYAERRIGTHTLWLAAADERAPGGESFVDLVERVAPAIDRLNWEHRGRDIVAVAHGGTIRAAIGLALGLAPQTALAFSTANCSLTRLDYLSTGEGGLWRIVAVNRLPRREILSPQAGGALR